MKQGLSLQEMASLVQYRGEMAMDYVVPVRHVDFSVTPDSDGNNSVKYQAVVPHHKKVAGDMTRHAMRQFATELSIPLKYADILLNEDPELLEKNLNERAWKSSGERMLRTVDDKLYGAVSPSFSRMYDNNIILNALLPTIANTEFNVTTCNLNDTMMHLALTSERLKGEVKVGDIVQGGIKMRNSGVGASRMSFARLSYRLWCLNGCTHAEVVDSYSRVHRGVKQPLGILYADDTIKAHANVIALEIRDTVKQLLDPDVFEQELGLMRASTERTIEGDVVKVVEVLGKTVGYTKDEGSDILKHLISGGDLSQWGMLNAVTRSAQDNSSYNRSMELEAIGGKVLMLSPKQWEQVSEAA